MYFIIEQKYLALKSHKENETSVFRGISTKANKFKQENSTEQ